MTQFESDSKRAPGEATFRLMFDGHAAVMLLIEPETGDILDANQAAVGFYGYPKSKLCSMSIQEINTLPPEQVKAERQKAFQEARNHFVFPHRLASGQERIVEVHSSPIRLGEKRVLFSIIHDITRRKRAETALKKSEARYRAVTQSAHEAIIIGDSAGNIIEWNRSAQTIFGYSEDELLGQPLTALMPARFREVHQAGVQHAQTGGRRQAGKTIEMVGRRKDGNEFPLEYSISEWQDEDGQFYAAIIRDIAERKQAEERVRQIANELRVTLDTVTVGISHWKNRQVEWANAAHDEMFGYALGETRGMQTSVFYPDSASFERMEQAAYPQLLAGKIYRADLEMCKRDGARFWCSLTGRVANVAQPAEGFIWMIEDISERKRTEDALKLRESYLTAIIENQPGLVSLKDIQGQFLAVNRAFSLACKKKTADEILGKTDLDVWPRELAEKYRADDAKIIQQKTPLYVEESIVDDGLIKWFETFKMPVLDETRQVIGITSFVRDTTERKRIEEELRESENRFRAISETAGDSIFVITPDGKLSYVNELAAQSFGITPSALIGREVRELFPPETFERQWGRLQKVFKTGESLYAESMARFPRGDVWQETWLTPLRDESGRIIAVLGDSRDITQRKKAEEALRESEMEYRRLINLLPSGVVVHSAGKIILANNTSAKLFGAEDPQELIGSDLMERVHPDYRNFVLDRIRQTTQKEAMLPWISEKLLRLDGAVFDAEVAAMSILYAGKPSTLAMFNDISERKQLEHELQVQRDFATQIINTMGQGLTVTDADGRFEFVNPAYARLFGYETSDLLGKHPVDVTTPEHRDILRQQRLARMAGKTTAYETDLRRADGSIAPVLITGVPRMHGGQYAGAIAVITDLTEQKHIENELRRAKDELERANQHLGQALIREQKLARTDALTGLNNRGYLFELAAREFEVAVRYQKPLSVMMFDIDNFKEINDTFGHSMGDQALIHVSQTILAILRATDMIGRYGGDEFSILLPHTSAQNAFSLARRIHARLAAARIETEKGLFTLTISLGIAQTIYGVTSPPDTVEDLFLRADKALYIAKQTGKNRSVIFESKEQ